MSDDKVRVKGSVKWFNEQKAFGFLILEGYNRDVFVHRSQMVRSGVESLTEDEKVSCVVRDGPKGLFAVEIRKEK